MKKKFLACLTASVLAFGTALPAGAAVFPDTEGHWAELYIDAAYAAGLVAGDGGGSDAFRPEDTITRAEFLKMLTACIGENAELSGTAELNHWVSPYYHYANETFLADGSRDAVTLHDGNTVQAGVLTETDADLPIERWEMAYLVWEYLNTYLQPQNIDASSLTFRDKDQILQNYPQSIQNMIAYVTSPALMLFTGDENYNFNAPANATRAEAVTLAVRAKITFDSMHQQLEELQNGSGAPTADENGSSSAIGGSSSSEGENTGSSVRQEHSIATVTMEDGQSFQIELYPEYAPETVANFISLAESGFYDGLTFHRVVDGFMAQGGDPNGDGTGGAEKTIKGEFAANGFTQNTLSHTRGVVSMARSSNPDSASSQFFICYGDASYLDGQYAAFGKVIKGMDVVDGFLETERTANSAGEIAVPVEPIVIQSITISEKE